MKKNFFASDYTSSDGLLSVLKFITFLKQNLLKRLSSELNLLLVDTPKICKFQNNLSTRMINFDSKETEQVFQIVTQPCEYLNNLWTQLNEADNAYSGLITQYTKYERDAIVNNCKYIYNDVIDLRFKVNTLDKNNFLELINIIHEQIFSVVNNVVNNYKNIDPKMTINDKFLQANYKVKSLSKFFRLHQTLKINDFIRQIASEFKYVYLTNINQIKSQYLNQFSDYDHPHSNAQLLWFHPTAGEIVNLMQMCLSKDEDDFVYLHISLNLEQLIMVLINKAHIAEVLPGSWSEELKKESLKKKVNIL